MTANIVNIPSCSIPASDQVRAGFFVSRYGFNFRATRKNKQREKNPAPGAGLIAAGSRESRKSALKAGQNGTI
jgi:predicted alpha/beta-hydrolase family hydrolase